MNYSEIKLNDVYSGKIYRIENKINGKSYIGMTSLTVNQRWGEHLYKSTKEDGLQAIHHSIVKYGVDNFEITTLESGISTKEETLAKEIYYIDKFNTFINLDGYNMTRGGEGNGGWNSNEVIKVDILTGKRLAIYPSMSEAMRKNVRGIEYVLADMYNNSTAGGYCYYRLDDVLDWGEEDFLSNLRTRYNQIAQLTLEGELVRYWLGPKDIEDSIGINRSSISKCRQGSALTAGGYQWVNHSEIVKNGLPYPPREIRKGYRRPVDRLTITGEYLDSWKTATHAQKEFSIRKQDILRVCKNEGLTSGGYKWRYSRKEDRKEFERRVI